MDNDLRRLAIKDGKVWVTADPDSIGLAHQEREEKKIQKEVDSVTKCGYHRNQHKETKT